ncbi:MAG: DUF5674 family protein [Gemmatimonadota bacterium]|nr:DUF5674 family protein [Gemmatimonadota bacterium]
MTDQGLQFVRDHITRADLAALAEATFGDMVKAVVDLERGLMVVGGEMHADEEAALLDDGARQEHLWGINLYPGSDGDAFVEFDSMINVRPRAGNRSRSVENPQVQAAIRTLVGRLVRP